MYVPALKNSLADAPTDFVFKLLEELGVLSFLEHWAKNTIDSKRGKITFFISLFIRMYYFITISDFKKGQQVNADLLKFN